MTWGSDPIKVLTSLLILGIAFSAFSGLKTRSTLRDLRFIFTVVTKTDNSSIILLKILKNLLKNLPRNNYEKIKYIPAIP